jgi:hypothetical protein
LRRLALLILTAPFLALTASPEVADEVAGQEILDKYLTASKAQAASMRGVQMEVDIAAKLPKLEKQGTLRALRTISRLGQITYKALGFTGDNTIKNEVITRYLSWESEARDSGAIAITPANYKFRYKASIERNHVRTYVFQITPKKKAQGLFHGELWLDGETGMPMRESGRLVKTPSAFLKKVEFVRDYELHDGVSFPKHIQSTADVRLFGRAELTIDFSNFARQESAENDSAPRL